uniref:FMN-dependent NADH-azoreductase n=1 Tax=Pararhizobium sp. IMCC3301 TaxID=3067904 RepID=UPI0027427223|nr:NAD(P)H-dependent oxidoreductase [Pararhizobium sp. IMCC3301]
MNSTILEVNASARQSGSVSRQLVTELVQSLSADTTARIIRRDTASGIELVSEDWVSANQTPKPDRTARHTKALGMSDILIEEVRQADTLVIGVPIYNFAIPASLKAWIDQICRAGETFSYTEHGPVGLLTGKRAYLVITSGGVESGSDVDFATNYMKHVLGFIGIDDVQIIAADQLLFQGEEKLSAVRDTIENLAA